MKQCSNCPKAAKCKGRCRGCYNYWKRTGRDREIKQAPTHCSNCRISREERRIIKGRCELCYRHWIRYGRERNPITKEPHSPICLNCLKRKTFLINRCKLCYWYFRRTGQERPDILQKQPNKPAHPCANANCTKIIRQATRCSACRRHLKKYGRERTVEECKRFCYSHAKVKPRKCKVCGNPKLSGKGRCGACRTYWVRNRKERPRWLWDKTMGCLTCGIPLRTLTTEYKRAGRCILCYVHLRRHGTERPREAWGIGEHGWCDCGNRADHLLDGKPACTRCKDAASKAPRQPGRAG